MNKFKISRRSFTRSVTAATALLASPAYLRSSAFAAGADVVNVWTYANFIPDDFKKEFQKETGIKIRERLVDEQGTLFNLMVAEGSSPTSDIVTVAGHRYLQFVGSELLAPMDSGRLANWGNVYPSYSESDWSVVNGKKWGVPILAGAEVLAYNTEVVTPEEASSWDVMFDPKYKGQIAYIVQDMLSVMMLYKGYDGNMVAYLDDPAKAAEIVNEVRDLLIANKPMVRKYYSSGAEIQQMFINQDVVLAHAWNGPISKLIMDGFPVAKTIPKEGSYGFVYTLNVTNNGPHTDNAYKFLDALLARPEIGANMTKASGFISTFKGADAFLTDLEKKASSFTDEEVEALQFFRAEANEMKYKLIDPAVEAVKAA